MKLIPTRHGGKFENISVVDEAIEFRCSTPDLQAFKSFLESQQAPFWTVQAYHNTYAWFWHVSGPFEIKPLEGVATETKKGEIEEGLFGRPAEIERYQICYPSSSSGTFTVWPTCFRGLTSMLMSSRKNDEVTHVIGEKTIINQFKGWVIEDPRVERLSAGQLNSYAERLFEIRKFKAGEVMHTRDQTGFVKYAMQELGLTGKDALRCLRVLFQRYGDQLQDSNPNIFGFELTEALRK